MRFRPAFLFTLLLASGAGAEPASPRVLARYREMLAARPEEGTALERLWKEYRDTGRSAELLQEYRPQTSFAGRMVYGYLLRREGRGKEAVATFLAAAGVEPANPLPWLALAQLREGQPAEAAEAWEKAAALLPRGDARLPRVLQELGAAWMAAGEAARGAEAWEKMVALEPERAELRQRLAEEYLRHRLPERAQPHLAWLTSHAAPPERAQAWRLLARLHQQAGEIDQALRALEEGLALTAPGNWLRPELEGQLVRLCEQHGRVPELVQRYETYARENPRDAGGFTRLADLYHRLGEPEPERVALERLSALLPKSTEYRARLARLLARTDAPGAAAAYDALLAAQPGNADWNFERAELEIRQGHPEAAEARLTALLREKKEDETVRARALEFCERHRLTAASEALLSAAAAGGSEEAVVAYASFLFGRHQEEAGIAQLRRLVRDGSAASALRVSGWLRQQNLLAPAEEEARHAVAWAAADPPRRREALLLLGEIEAARGLAPEAQAAVEAAAQLSATPAEREETDQRLFGLLAPRGTRELAAVEEQLTQAAVSAGDFLRLARWQSWSRREGAASASLEHALALDPHLLAAHELAVRLASAAPGAPGAAAHLQRMAELDPAQATEYRRRSAQLSLQSGHPADAIETLQMLLRDRPADLDLLTDLATAEAAAERWEAALETWRRRLALSPPARQKECLTPMLSLCERLRQPRAAAELLLTQTTRAHGPEARELFDDLLALSGREKLLPWLRDEWQRRREEMPDDFFTELAWSEILKAGGEREQAFETLRLATYSAPEPAEVLPELVREAEELRHYPEAIALQEKAIRLAPEELPASFELLAELQEKAFALTAAEATWQTIRRRFPRDGEALRLGGEFYQRQGEPAVAAELLRQCVRLDGPVSATLLRLAACARAAGDTGAAEGALEEVLQAIPPPPRETSLRFPDLASERPEHEPRLQAIRELGQLFAARGDPALLARWTSRWQAVAEANPTEALCALAWAGAGEAALELAARFCGRSPAQWPNHESFIVLALRLREYARLGQWVGGADRPPETRELFRRLLARWLAEHGSEPEPALRRGLALAGAHGHGWEMAVTCAAAGGFRAALQLSEAEVEREAGQRAARLRERAGWYLGLGETAPALASLRAAAATEGESFEAPCFAAWREAWLLLPPAERGSLPPGGEGVSGALTRLLRAALEADREGVRQAAARLLRLRAMGAAGPDDLQEELASRPPGTARAWSFILATGQRLQEWHLRSAAAELWQQALADPALVALQGRQAQEVAGEVRTRLYALKLFFAEPAALDPLLAEYAREAPALDGVAAVAEALETMGALPRALLIYRRLWEREPSNPQLLRNLLNLCRRTGDAETLEAVLERCIAERLYAANFNVQRDLEIQLLDSLEHRQADGEAPLARALASSPEDVRLLIRRARGLSGREAETSWRHLLRLEPGQPVARMELARLLRQRGEYEPALAVLENEPPEAAQPLVATLLYAAGRTGESMRSAEQAAPAQQEAAALALAQAMSERGETREARIVLAAAVGRATEPLAALRLQQKLIETWFGHPEAVETSREWRRLRRLAEGNSARMGVYLAWTHLHAGELGLQAVADEELRSAWAGGKGLIESGLTVLSWQLDRREPGAAGTAELLLKREGLSAPLLQVLLGSLVSAQRPELAALAARQLADAFPAVPLPGTEAGYLLQAGLPEAAAASVARRHARAALAPELSAAAAQAWLAVGDQPRAESLLAAATARENLLPSPAPYLEYARLLRTGGSAWSARPLLQRALQYPGAEGAAEVAAWLRATGTGLGTLASFHPTPRQEAAVRKIFEAGRDR